MAYRGCKRFDFGVRERRSIVGSSATPDRLACLLRGGCVHGVLPLAYWQLNADCPDAVPSETMIRLRNAFGESSGRNLLFASELLNALEMLRGKRIRAVPLKGPALAFGVYENYALREFEDLDLLVPRSQAQETMDLLAASGYVAAS